MDVMRLSSRGVNHNSYLTKDINGNEELRTKIVNVRKWLLSKKGGKGSPGTLKSNPAGSCSMVRRENE